MIRIYCTVEERHEVLRFLQMLLTTLDHLVWNKQLIWTFRFY